MEKITIINETKKLSLSFLVDYVYKEKYEPIYGNWATEDQYTRMKIAEDNNEYILYGFEGFSMQPSWNDIRNKRINKHGSFRVSGTSNEISLNLITEPYLFCNKYKGSFLYDYLIATFTNQFDNIIIYFDLGCETVYQYYSFQDEDSGLASFNFLGSNGENYYYVVGGRIIYETLIPDRVFITPALTTVDVYNNKHDDNYINMPKQEVITQYLSLLETEYTLEMYPISGKFPNAFIEDIEISINGKSISILGRYSKIRISEEKIVEQYLENIGEWEQVSSKYLFGDLPAELINGMNDISFKTGLQRGEYTCQMHALVAARY